MLLSNCIGKYNMTDQNTQMVPSFVNASHQQNYWHLIDMLCGAIFMGGCYFWMFCFLIQQLHSPQLALYKKSVKVLKCVVVANLCRSIDRIKDMEPTKWLGIVKKLGRISQSYAPSWARVNDEARESDDPVETQPWFCRGTEHFLHQTWLVGTWKPQYHIYIYISYYPKLINPST